MDDGLDVFLVLPVDLINVKLKVVADTALDILVDTVFAHKSVDGNQHQSN